MMPGKPNTLYKKKLIEYSKYLTETAAQNIKNQLKPSTENKIEELKRKPMHVHFYWDLERPSVDTEKSLAWLCSSGLEGEMGSLIIAAQDQAHNTHYHHRNIMKQPVESRMCYNAEQHINILLQDVQHLHHLHSHTQ
jgi:hypothetical protein